MDCLHERSQSPPPAAVTSSDRVKDSRIVKPRKPYYQSRRRPSDSISFPVLRRMILLYLLESRPQRSLILPSRFQVRFSWNAPLQTMRNTLRQPSLTVHATTFTLRPRLMWAFWELSLLRATTSLLLLLRNSPSRHYSLNAKPYFFKLPRITHQRMGKHLPRTECLRRMAAKSLNLAVEERSTEKWMKDVDARHVKNRKCHAFWSNRTYSGAEVNACFVWRGKSYVVWTNRTRRERAWENEQSFTCQSLCFH